MSWVIVDVESDGPISAEFSMVCFGAVVFDDRLDRIFYGRTRPTSDDFIPGALAVSGFSREQHLAFDDPKAVMENFAAWLDEHSKGRPIFVSDNLAFDWQFINYYFCWRTFHWRPTWMQRPLRGRRELPSACGNKSFRNSKRCRIIHGLASITPAMVSA